MDWNMFIFWGVIIFFTLIMLVGGSVFWYLWRRRKLTFTNFLSDTGQWERKSWKPEDIGVSFTYDNETYRYDIKHCTRDALNRPIAHYYKGNPEQQLFNFAEGHKNIRIGTKELTGKDFHVLMLSKVLRDIFQDDEVMNMLLIIIIEVAVIGLLTIVLVVTHHPSVPLKNDNQTINIIAEGVKLAITQKL